MDIASMVIGIVFTVIGFVPFCTYVSIIPALAGLGLGIAALLQKTKTRNVLGFAITGVVLNGIVVLYALYWIIVNQHSENILKSIIQK